MTCDEVMKAQDKLCRTLPSEFQLNLQTIKEEQLRDTVTIKGEYLSFVEDLRTETAAFGDRLHDLER